MSTSELSGQETGESADERRAQQEEFSMVVVGGDGGGHVNVRNDSHDNPNEHIHTVRVEDGHAVDCRCAHAKYRDARCKHQIAVENHPLVLSSASAASAVSAANAGQQVATDGGTQRATHADEPDTEADDNQTDTDDDENRPQTDHWGHAVQHFDDEPVGAGEKSECQSCGSRFEIAMIAATADNTRNWEEFYECQQCGATGSFRFYGKTERREWTGRIAYPD